ncbi:BTAD domain-containing putative transcriptional regulator [Streptomyces sp. NPDC059909]|uniref:BTAD domain-containing putative transcriptional regulator n=1 Tax=Streptomyces sp. NPDC059909 TaxID=3346998 RepID=UPI003653B944
MRFGVLGPLAVWTVDGELVVVPESKVRALLAALLVDPGRVVPSDRLVEDLWGDAPPANPAGALQTRVSRLRRALTRAGGRDLVVHRPPGYLLRVADDAVDSGRFAALTRRARTTEGARERASLLTEALSLWRGPAFADFADEPFVRAAVARLEEQRLLALEEQAEARLELGEHGLLAGELGDHTDRHPLRERLRAAHVRALYGAGRPSEALDSYHELRRSLDEELGLEPGPELVALHGEILRQDPALRAATPADATTPPRPRTNLPTPVTDLIGRSESVSEVRGMLESGRLVTLTGPGGVGKTRLAVEIATRLAGTFADGAWLVELATQAHPGEPGPADSVDALAEVVAATLGIRDDTSPGPLPAGRPHTLIDRLVGALRGKQLLLVLDNCEHVVEPASRLAAALLRGAPGVRILATSQEPLDIAGERLWSVPPLDLPGAEAAPSVLRRSSAVQLFEARAAAASPGFAITDENAAAVASICRRLDGIPLALELASTRVRVLGVRELAERLDDRFRLLTGGHRGAPARQQTLRAMIDWSWELLTAAEQIVLRRLAVHSDGCTLEAAETLCAGDGVKPSEVVDLLARLVDRSLVLVAHDADGPRYRLLESVAAYCLERLRASDHEQVRRAHDRYYVAFAEGADAFLRGADQQRWLRRLDVETANIRSALDGAAADGDAPLARRLVRAMSWYWFLRGRLTEAKRSLAMALAVPDAPPDALPDTPPDASPDRPGAGAPGACVEPVVAWRAGMSMLSGDEADPAWEGAAVRKLYEDVGDPHERARAGWFLGFAMTKFGDMAVGEDLTDRVLADFRALGDRWGIAAVLSTRGMQRYVCGDLTLSRRDGEESLALFREVGDRWGQLQAMAVLGRLAEIAGDYVAADRWHRDGLRVAEDLGLWTEASVRWSELGRIALLTGDHARAEEFHERGRRLAVEQGDKPAEEFAEVGLALGARRQGRLDEAEAYLRGWLEWNRQFDAEYGAALILAELGFVAELRGDAQGALALHEDGLAAAGDTGDPRAIALALEGLAGAHALAGRPERAARLLGAAAAARSSVGAPLPAAERGDVDRVTAAAREALGDDGFEAAFGAGAELGWGVELSSSCG